MPNIFGKSKDTYNFSGFRAFYILDKLEFKFKMLIVYYSNY